jgi:hypothetical protein
MRRWYVEAAYPGVLDTQIETRAGVTVRAWTRHGAYRRGVKRINRMTRRDPNLPTKLTATRFTGAIPS